MTRRSIHTVFIGLGLLLISAPACLAAEPAGGLPETLGTGERMATLMLQLAVVLVVAKAGGFVCERYLRLPDVLGELGAGIVVGPHLLGGWSGLFAAPEAGALPVSPELYGIATLASVVLLYLAGLETDVTMFLRYSVVGSLVGLGGVVVSFAVGDVVAVWSGLAPGYGAPAALFLGTISTATSVGITARILSQRNQLDSPEGVTILSGAVIDDVVGLVVLAVVVGIGKVTQSGGVVEWWAIAGIAAKAIGFWLGCTVAGILFAKRISKVLEFFGSRQTMATLSLGLALLLAGLAEKAGLAMIIGAYITGLSMSRVDSAHELRRRLEPVYSTIVCVFFAVMGMMVDLHAVRSVLLVGLAYSLAAMGAKILGCGIPALLLRFNPLGAFRIGVGMLPRGEVTLLVAGVGLAGGFIDARIFGVAVMVTLLSTLIAPLVMVRVFDDRLGLRGDTAKDTPGLAAPISLKLPNSEIAIFLLSRIIRMFEVEECYVHQLGPGRPLYQIRKDDIFITVSRDDAVLNLSCGSEDREFARLMLLEALAELAGLFEGLRQLDRSGDLRTQVLSP